MTGKWIPIYNEHFRAYAVFRQKDVNSANCPENREYHESGAIFADEATAQRVCDDLNNDCMEVNT